METVMTQQIWKFAPRDRKETVLFEVFGTDQPITPPDGGEREYLGTAQVGSFVWHVFRRNSILA